MFYDVSIFDFEIISRDLLTESGSIFVQIGDENVHRVRTVLDEIFGEDNFVSQITIRKTGSVSSPDAKVNTLGNIADIILWYAKDKYTVKYRQLYSNKLATGTADQYKGIDGDQKFQSVTVESNGHAESFNFDMTVKGKSYLPSPNRHWSTTYDGLIRVNKSDRIITTEKNYVSKNSYQIFLSCPLLTYGRM